jgi:hypothetical protein
VGDAVHHLDFDEQLARFVPAAEESMELAIDDFALRGHRAALKPFRPCPVGNAGPKVFLHLQRSILKKPPRRAMRLARAKMRFGFQGARCIPFEGNPLKRLITTDHVSHTVASLQLCQGHRGILNTLSQEPEAGSQNKEAAKDPPDPLLRKHLRHTP